MREFSFQGGWPGLALALALGLLVAGCSDNDAPDNDLTSIHAPEIVRIVPAQEALAGAVVSKLDPAPMNDAEVRKAVGAGPLCAFRYTTAGRPVLAVRTHPDGSSLGGTIKVNGSMIALRPAPAPANATGPEGLMLLVADPIRMTVAPDQAEPTEVDGVRRREADAVFEVGQGLRVGYRGYLDCMSEPQRKSRRH